MSWLRYGALYQPPAGGGGPVTETIGKATMTLTGKALPARLLGTPGRGLLTLTGRNLTARLSGAIAKATMTLTGRGFRAVRYETPGKATMTLTGRNLLARLQGRIGRALMTLTGRDFSYDGEAPTGEARKEGPVRTIFRSILRSIFDGDPENLRS